MLICNKKSYIKERIMDNFDNYYENMNKNENSRFNLEQEELFNFGSSKITMILVIILWALVLYPFLSSFIFSGVDVTQYINFENIPGGMPAGYEPTELGGGVFSTIIQIIISLIIPYGFFLIYTGSKSKDKNKVANGAKYTKVYFQIQKIILIIAAVIFGLGMLFALLAAPGVALISLLIFGGIFFVLFKIYNMFIEFFSNLSLTALGKYRPVPLALNIKTVFVVLLVLNIIGLVIGIGVIAIFSAQTAYFPEISDYIDLPGFFKELIPIILVGVVISLGSSIFYIYYIDKYNKHFNEFNHYVRDLESKQEQSLE